MKSWVKTTFFTCEGRMASPTEADSPPDHLARAFALDDLGWVALSERQDRVEIWMNPLKASARAVVGSAEYLAALNQQRPWRPLVVKVHDGVERGTVGVKSACAFRSWIVDAIALTSRPYFPLEQERLPEIAITETADGYLQSAWKMIVGAGFRLDKELITWVETNQRRAKVVLIAVDGSVQYIAHDRVTPALWVQSSSFAGRFLADLPVPTALKMSVQSDTDTAFQSRRPVVSFVKGLGRLGSPLDRVADQYLRLTIPLTTPQEREEVPALMVLSSAA